MLRSKKKTNITDTQGLLQELDEATSNILANNMSHYITTSTGTSGYNTITMGSYGNTVATAPFGNGVYAVTPRTKSTAVLKEELEEVIKTVASEYENALADKLPDSTKDEVRELALTIIRDIWGLVSEKQWELWESIKNYTVTL